MKVENNMNFGEVEQKIKGALLLYAHTEAKRMEGYAKENRPWTDRTGNAKNSMLGAAGWRKDDLVIRLSGNMHYSVQLELAYGKKYSIIRPTIEKHSPEILKGYQVLGGR